MNVYEYSLHAVGFLPGECDEPTGHKPEINAMGDRIVCDLCGVTGPLAHEWSPSIKRAVLVEATIEPVAV